MITEDNKGEYNLTVTLGDEVTPRGIQHMVKVIINFEQPQPPESEEILSSAMIEQTIIEEEE